MLGRLVTDAETRRRFRLAPVRTLQELRELGIELTPVEVEALSDLDPADLNRFAQALDRRLRKAVLVAPDREQETPDESGERR